MPVLFTNLRRQVFSHRGPYVMSYSKRHPLCQVSSLGPYGPLALMLLLFMLQHDNTSLQGFDQIKLNQSTKLQRLLGLHVLIDMFITCTDRSR